MVQLNVGPVLRSALGQEPWSVPTVLEGLGRDMGGSDVVVYLVDFGQVVLEPLGDYSAHVELPRSEEVASTMAGRAFLSEHTVTAERDGRFRLWAPVLEGSDRTGVLAVTVADVEPATVEAFEDLALFAGYMIAIHSRVTDVFNLHRRRKAMSLPASMQWDLLPPLVFRSARVAVCGFLEPAYEVGGDCFDYAVNGPMLDLAIMDSMGHGLNSAVLAGLAVGCYRHNRRHGGALDAIHQQLDTTIETCSQGDGGGFVTGQLAQLDLERGTLHWTNAGHPLPLHIRNGKVIGQLRCAPSLPWGLGGGTERPEVAVEVLEPKDRLLFYTDGVVDNKATSGGAFGLDRLADLAGQTASGQRTPEQVVQDLIRAILRHQDNRLVDDATLVMVEWSGPVRIEQVPRRRR
jgi:hypothetical protein